MGHTAISATKASPVTLRFSNEVVMNYGDVILQISSFPCLFLAKTFDAIYEEMFLQILLEFFFIFFFSCFFFFFFFFFFCSNHRLWVHDRTALPKRFQRVPAIYVLEQK